MGASYWARWTCTGHVSDLPNLLLPHVLAEGYELLAFDDGRQLFDRGGVLKKIAWSLNGGKWSDAPVDLSVTYSFSDDKTMADFRWSLAVRPLPATHKEQASYEAWIRSQLERMIFNLTSHSNLAWTDAATQEPLGIHDEHEAHPHSLLASPTIGRNAAVLIRPAPRRTSVQYASTYVEQAPHCDRCWKSAVAIPGTTGRYFCLTCHRHLPRQTSYGPA